MTVATVLVEMLEWMTVVIVLIHQFSIQVKMTVVYVMVAMLIKTVTVIVSVLLQTIVAVYVLVVTPVMKLAVI